MHLCVIVRKFGWKTALLISTSCLYTSLWQQSFDQKVMLKICKIILIDSIQTKHLHKHKPAFIDKFIYLGSFMLDTYMWVDWNLIIRKVQAEPRQAEKFIFFPTKKLIFFRKLFSYAYLKNFLNSFIKSIC